MATQPDSRSADEFGRYTWLTGIIAGLVSAVVTGVVIQFGFNPTVLSEGIPSGFGVTGLVAGWVIFLVLGAALGVVYSALTQNERMGDYAVRPRPAAYLGLFYGLVLWIVAVIVVPLWVGGGMAEIGSYAVNLRGLLSFALLGIIIGLVYGVVPHIYAND